MTKAIGRNEVFQSVDALFAALIPGYKAEDEMDDLFDPKRIADLLQDDLSSQKKKTGKSSSTPKRSRKSKTTRN